MSETYYFRDLVEHEIGGGWGSDVSTAESATPAFVIRGTDIPAALVGDVATIPSRFHKESSLRSRSLKNNDIVFEVSGGSKGQPVGRTLLVNQRLLDQLKPRAICASFCKLIRIDPARCDPRYVFRLLQLAYRDGTLSSYQVQSTGITNFRWKPFLEQFSVKLPSLRQQADVSAVFDSFDEVIENIRWRIALLERMAQAIYQEWFIRFRYPGHEHADLIGSSVGAIPAGWRAGRVDDHLLLQRGFDLPTKEREYGNIPVLAATGIHGSHSKARARGPGVVTGRSGTIGVVTYVPSDYWPLNTVLWVKEFRLATPLYAYFLLDSLNLQHAAVGAAVPTLNRNHVHAMPVVCPPAELIKDWQARVEAMFVAATCLREQTRRLESIRDLLLSRLVTGDIDGSELDLKALFGSVS